MLQFSETKNEFAIENIVCSAIKKSKKEPINDEDSEILISLLMSNAPLNIPEKEKPFLYKVIEKRIEFSFDFTMENKLILFLCQISKSPGNALLYLWYLQYWSNKNFKNITLHDFCEKIFPMGFPSEDEMNKIWLAQKVANESTGSDNLIDYNLAGKSLFKIIN